jgi:broad specificity phosphatase PhoE
LGPRWTATAENLHEQERQGVPHFESKRAFEAAVGRLLTGPENELLLGSETAAQARQRFDRAVKEVLVQHSTGNIAIVSHGTVITLFLCAYHSALSPLSFWRNLKLPDYLVVYLPDFTLEM